MRKRMGGGVGGILISCRLACLAIERIDYFFKKEI